MVICVVTDQEGLSDQREQSSKVSLQHCILFVCFICTYPSLIRFFFSFFTRELFFLALVSTESVQIWKTKFEKCCVLLTVTRRKKKEEEEKERGKKVTATEKKKRERKEERKKKEQSTSLKYSFICSSVWLF